MHRDLLTMARQRDIGELGIHHAAGHDMDAIVRGALRFVDRRGIAMVDVVVAVPRDRDGLHAIGDRHVETTFHDLFHDPDRAVAHAKLTVVLEEQHAVANGEFANTSGRHEPLTIGQTAIELDGFTGQGIQGQDVTVRMGQHHDIGAGGPIVFPALNGGLIGAAGGLVELERVVAVIDA